jgi:transcriptional regulator with XRE-family HTH domain
MGRASRPKPVRLAEKLIEIRGKLGLSQNEMVSRMGLTGEITREEISKFERGVRVPPLPILLGYAQAAGVYVDVLIDDEVDIPRKIPCAPKHEGIKRAHALKGRQKIDAAR